MLFILFPSKIIKYLLSQSNFSSLKLMQQIYLIIDVY